MIELKFAKNTDTVILSSDDGQIFISPAMQGRIFASLGDKLLHRFDSRRAASPLPFEFNNIGGNSLWPAPEGGDFAYNYPPDGEWYVQKDINIKPYELVSAAKSKVLISRDVNLLNRKGIEVKMKMQRTVSLLKNKFKELDKNIQMLAYKTLDTLEMLEAYSIDHVLAAAWSLEQFELTPNATAFGIFKGNASASSLNTDFYADPTDVLSFKENAFSFKLAGSEKLQIALHKNSNPLFIGAYIPEKDLWILRRNQNISNGVFFNIADNEQKDGAFSSADSYSIFYGAQADFFELETIAPMAVRAGDIANGSSLGSETYFFRGDFKKIVPFMKKFLNINSIPDIF